MKPVYLVTLFWVISSFCWSQNYPIGHRTNTYYDSDRGNRPIPTEAYYPASSAGENTPLYSGSFPVVIFGHGFQMAYDSYAYFKNAVVSAGYIVVFPKTETSLSPNHAEYGADLAFLVVQMKSEGSNVTSSFFGHIDSTSAIMGHSMGGGASFLGCKNNSTPTAMVTWAAAGTVPSAIAAARNITLPSLVFAADHDCITPPASNQIPMYDSLASDCKVLITIKGGGHCYFADANFLCSLGEVGCTAFPITREQQHSTTLDFTKLFLARYLKNQADAWTAFLDSLSNSPRITSQKSCTTTSVAPGLMPEPFKIFPNPSGDVATLSGSCSGCENAYVRVSDISGREILSFILVPEKNQYQAVFGMDAWKRGVYFAEIRNSQESRVIKIVKN
ncbi:MAG: T9SS type A sorting domain-containing protein [Bacteroidetes bacterium]|nr:T9SS type A sorting domain-containing protein [Bacteroidota bacterium]